MAWDIFSNNKKKKLTTNSKDNIDLDDLDIDDDFDFDFGDSKIKDNGSPITKNTKSALSGFKESFFSYPNNYKELSKLVNKLLPSTYGEVTETSDLINKKYNEVLNKSTDQLRTLKPMLKNISRKLATSGSEYLPEKLLKQLEKFGEQNNSDYYSDYQQNHENSTVNLLLNDIFSKKEKAEQARYRDNENKNLQRDLVNFNFNKQSLYQLDSIRQGVQSLQQYQDNILINFQRKSLELQIKQLSISSDTLRFMKTQHYDLINELKSIKINTGLPDFVKMSKTNSFKELLRNKFIDNLQTSLFKTGKSFLPSLIENLGNNAINGANVFTQTAMFALSGIDGALDASESFQNEANPYFVGGNLVGDWLRNKAINKFSNKINQNSKINKFNKLMSNAGIWINNSEANIRDLLNKEYENNLFSQDDYDDSNSSALKRNLKKINPLKRGSLLRSGLLSLLEQSFYQTANTKDISFGRDNLTSLSKQSVLTGKVNKSITEVLPGYLARILKEVTILRTGNENIDLVQYDFVHDKFSTKDSVKKSIINKITANGKFADHYLSNMNSGIYDKLSDDSKFLTDGVKNRLNKLFINSARNGQTIINKQWLTNPNSFSSIGSKQLSEKIALMFKNYLEDDTTGSKELDLVRQIRNSISTIGNPLAFLQDIVNVGQSDILSELGLIDENNGTTSLNEDNYINYLFGKKVAGSKNNNIKVNKTKYNFTSPIQRNENAFNKNELEKEEQSSSVISLLNKIIETNTYNNEKLIESVYTSSNRDISSNIFNGVMSIYERLAETQAIAVSQLTGEPIDSKEIISAKDLPWFKKGRTFTDQMKVFQRKITSATLGALGKGLKWSVLGPSKAAWWMTKTVFKTPYNIFKGVKETKNRLDNLIGDVYIKGELSPRITKLQLVRGLYIDRNTGRKIKNFKDITGDVVDQEGNVILAADEVKNAYVSLGVTKKTISLAAIVGSKIWDIGWGVLSGVTDIYTASMKAAWSVVKFGFNTTKNFLKDDPPQDVYAAGVRGPVMTAKLMRRGMYFDVNTGKYIKGVKGITGAVIDSNGDVVLTEEQFEAGITNKYGQPIGGNLRRLFNFGARRIGDIYNVGAGALKLANKAAVGAAKLTWNSIKWTGGALKSILSGRGIRLLSFDNPEQATYFTASASNTIIDKLKQIYDLLDDRMADQTVDGDHDGSGFKDGSVAEQMAKRRAAKLAKSDSFKITPNDTPIEQLVKLFKKFTKKQEEQMSELIEETDENGDISAFGSAMDWFGGRGKRGKGGKAPKGKVGRLGRLGRIGGKALGGLAAAGMAYSAYNSVKQGDYVEAGLETTGAGLAGASVLGGMKGAGKFGKFAGKISTPLAIGLGGYETYQNYKKGDYEAATGSVTGTAGAIGGMALGAKLGGVIGTFIAPGIGTAIGAFLGGVVGGIAGSSVGSWIGKKIYKGWKWLTGGDNDKWHLTRLAQYGFLDKDKGDSVFKLEEICENAMVIAGGVPEISGEKIDQNEIMGLFNVTPEDQEGVAKFRNWFLNRFKPIWQANISLLHKLKPNAKLANIGNLSTDLKNQFVDSMLKLNDGAYSYMGSPFKGENLLQADAKNVRYMLLSLQKDISKGTDKGKSKLGTLAKLSLFPLGGGALLAKDLASKALDKDSKDGKNLSKPELSKFTSKFSKALMLGPLGLSGLGATAAIEYLIPSANAGIMDGNNIDPLVAIRVKAYGLNDIDPSKVRDLMSLEMKAFNYITITTNKVSVTGDIEELTNNVSSSFGGEPRETFVWIKYRFLPVFTAFIGALKSQGIDSDFLIKSNGLPASKKIAIADALKAVNNVDGMSIWSVSSSPWKNYVLSNNSAITNVNYLVLSTKAKSETMSEQKVSDAKLKTAEKTGIFGNIVSSLKAFTSGIGSAYDAVKDSVSNTMTNVSEGISNLKDDVSEGIENLGESISNSIGNTIGFSKDKKKGFAQVMEAARKAGDPHPEIVAAQWALESYWGEKQSGRFNYFGIKARGNEPGTYRDTQEEINGRRVRTKARFKDYSSLEEGIRDRVHFIQRNPRYRKYFEVSTASQAAVSLQAAKYATDSSYARKLISIIKSNDINPDKPSNAIKLPTDGGFPTWGKGTGNQQTTNNTAAPKVNKNPVNRNTNTVTNRNIPASRNNFSNSSGASYKAPSIPAGGGYGESISNTRKNQIINGNAAAKASVKALNNANNFSTGYCARYVSNALLSSGFKFNKKQHAYQYHTDGVLSNLGFRRIPYTGNNQPGDIMVFGKTPRHRSGHIQIYSPNGWVSDFRQKGISPYKDLSGYSLNNNVVLYRYGGGNNNLNVNNLNNQNLTNKPAIMASSKSNRTNRSNFPKQSYGDFVSDDYAKVNMNNTEVQTSSTSDYPTEVKTQTNDSSDIFSTLGGLFPHQSSKIDRVSKLINIGKDIYDKAKKAGSNIPILNNNFGNPIKGRNNNGINIGNDLRNIRNNELSNGLFTGEAFKEKQISDRESIEANKYNQLNDAFNAVVKKATDILLNQLEEQRVTNKKLDIIIKHISGIASNRKVQTGTTTDNDDTANTGSKTIPPAKVTEKPLGEPLAKMRFSI